MKPTKTLVENIHWVEIAALTRLAFVAGNHSKQAIHTQLYIPEIVHLVTLIAGTGPTLVRKSVYGIVLNYLQSLYSARNDDEDTSEVLSLIEEFTQPSILSLFGLARTNSTSEYTDLNPENDKGFLEIQEGLVQLLIRVMETTAGTKGAY
jgi:neurofibromin 1